MTYSTNLQMSESQIQNSQFTVLVVDDDDEIRYSLGRVLGSQGYQIDTAASGEEGIEKVKHGPAPDLIFMDIRMGGITGLETLQHMRAIDSNLQIILMTAFGTAQTAIEAMKFGAHDYVMKPFDPEKVISLASSAIAASQDLRMVSQPSKKVNSEDYKEGIVGKSAAIQEVFKTIGQVAASDATVLVTGESGTGKELIANCVFQHSLRSGGPFMAVNCAAIPENLIESELFGHEKGSFTGATSQRIGKFEHCDRGTIFLDEIGDMSLATQTKILRVLQDGEIQRVGGSETIKVDARVLAATNKDLETMVREKEFREDLYYRLNVFRIRVPSLRERQEDVPDIVDFMLQKLVNERKAKATRLSDEAMATLSKYSWPGNVRELGNVVYHSAVVAQGGIILVKDLPDTLLTGGDIESMSTQSSGAPIVSENVVTGDFDAPAPVAPISNGLRSLAESFDFVYEEVKSQEGKRILTYIEKQMIQRAIADTGGNQARAAEILGITRNTLKKRLDEFARDA
jgi:DNA-binding NtrC family response regulator